MPIRSITKMGHPVLRAKARELTRDELRSPEIQRLIDDMTETMRDAEGVGLAAPQVYEPVRLFVAEVRAEDEEDDRSMPLIALANPEIVKVSREVDSGWEGCLSIPNVHGVVPRHRAMVVRGLDRDGNAVTAEVQGYHARIFQHEIDHLDGVLFMDRMPDLRTLTFHKEFERFWLHNDEEDEAVE